MTTLTTLKVRADDVRCARRLPIRWAGLLIFLAGCPGTLNLSPVADAGRNQRVNGGDTVTLDGSKSFDRDSNAPLTYRWVQIGGDTVTLSDDAVVRPTFVAPEMTTLLTFELFITDEGGASDGDVVTVEVVFDVSNTPPIADAGDDQVADAGERVTLDGSGSSDPDGDSLTFEWEQVGGVPVTLSAPDQEQTSFVAPNADDVLEFELTVDDGRGGLAADRVKVQIQSVSENVPPVADAGDDQIVDRNADVALNGTLSTDPEGLPLAYSWAQTAGPEVEITGADQANATFTAPDEAAILIFELTVADEGGLSDADSVIVTVQAAIDPRLLVAGRANDNVVAFLDPQGVEGDVLPEANLQGSRTGLADPIDLAVNLVGELFVLSGGNDPSIRIFESIEALNGNLAPIRAVVGEPTRLTQPSSMIFDASRDMLYVIDRSASQVLVFEDVSQEGFDGEVEPARSFDVLFSAEPNEAVQMALSAEDELYVIGAMGGEILIFDHPSALNGAVEPDRVILSDAIVDPVDLAVTASDDLLVLGGSAELLVFKRASTLEGATAADLALTIDGFQEATALAIDSAGIGFILDAAAEAVLIYDGVADLNGRFPPSRVLQGAQTQLGVPSAILIVE